MYDDEKIFKIKFCVLSITFSCSLYQLMNVRSRIFSLSIAVIAATMPLMVWYHWTLNRNNLWNFEIVFTYGERKKFAGRSIDSLIGRVCMMQKKIHSLIASNTNWTVASVRYDHVSTVIIGFPVRIHKWSFVSFSSCLHISINLSINYMAWTCCIFWLFCAFWGCSLLVSHFILHSMHIILHWLSSTYQATTTWHVHIVQR